MAIWFERRQARMGEKLRRWWFGSVLPSLAQKQIIIVVLGVWVMVAKTVWVTCYDRDMGYGVKIPPYQHGISANVWAITEYGLYPVWLISESTV